MQVKDLLSNRKTEITYRTNHPQFGDLFAGAAMWDGEELISLDGDLYSVEDEIEEHEFRRSSNDEPDKLTVWYKSTWVTA